MIDYRLKWAIRNLLMHISSDYLEIHSINNIIKCIFAHRFGERFLHSFSSIFHLIVLFNCFSSLWSDVCSFIFLSVCHISVPFFQSFKNKTFSCWEGYYDLTSMTISLFWFNNKGVYSVNELRFSSFCT